MNECQCFCRTLGSSPHLNCQLLCSQHANTIYFWNKTGNTITIRRLRHLRDQAGNLSVLWTAIRGAPTYQTEAHLEYYLVAYYSLWLNFNILWLDFLARRPNRHFVPIKKEHLYLVASVSELLCYEFLFYTFFGEKDYWNVTSKIRLYRENEGNWLGWFLMIMVENSNKSAVDRFAMGVLQNLW